MGHYPNYNAAYEQALEDYTDVLSNITLLNNYIDQMATYAEQENWGTAFIYCKAALQRVSWSLKYLIGYVDFPENDAPVIDAIYYNRVRIDNHTHPPQEITYQTIVEAWAKNNFEGRGVTIAFIDRMRQLIWDEPFYAVWAAAPEKEY